MMKFIGENLATGNVASAAWVSLLFAVVVVIYGLFFTRNLMDLLVVGTWSKRASTPGDHAAP